MELLDYTQVSIQAVRGGEIKTFKVEKGVEFDANFEVLPRDPEDDGEFVEVEITMKIKARRDVHGSFYHVSDTTPFRAPTVLV